MFMVFCVWDQGPVLPVSEAVQRRRQRLWRGSGDGQQQHQGSLQEGSGSQGAQGESLNLRHRTSVSDSHAEQSDVSFSVCL